MKLSIVTSYYNSSKYIEQQSASILSQTYQNWEWIICDDFSTDDTKEKLLQLSAKDHRIKLVEPRYKKEVWWNPQTYASGDVICPIDGDDKILPGTFEKIVYYFNQFPEVVLMHFNANKYQDDLPDSEDQILNKFVDNVYMSRDNSSFLEAFERLWPNRSCIFGYLRIFRNLPGISFKVHEDGSDCSSNDGQWLMTMEEKGKWLTIPRTTYLARQHFDSENFRNWNLRGEVTLVKEARERRKKIELEMPRSSDFYNDIYVAAESTYLSKLNWESERKKVGFFNYNYTDKQKERVKHLFFDHDIFFDQVGKYDYTFIRIDYVTDVELLESFLKLASGNVSLFCDNIHLHNNNRTGRNTLKEIHDFLNSNHVHYWNYQENRAIFYIHKRFELDMEEILKAEDIKDSPMETILQEVYEKTTKVIRDKKEVKNVAAFTFIDGPRVSVEGPVQANYRVLFIDDDNNRTIYETEIGNNSWAACSIKYLVNWRIEVYENGNLWKVHKFNPEGKRVYVHLDSSSLGDTLAWFPVIDEFRKKWNCQVVCSTFKNEFFEGNYPELEFVTPGNVVHNLYAKFGIGWYYNDDNFDRFKNKVDFKMIPLQKTAHDILGLDYQEVKPKIFDKSKAVRQIEGPYVCIAPHASALAKYWNKPGGWQEIIDYLNANGYKVVLISQEPHGDAWHDSKLGGTLQNVINKSGDLSIFERYQDLAYADAFIGVGSGLSWLAWATGTPVVMISGFSYDWTEFSDCQRITTSNPNSCTGCFNRHKLDAGDWWWCPDHKGTDRQFECTKTIQTDTVKDALKNILPNLS